MDARYFGINRMLLASEINCPSRDSKCALASGAIRLATIGGKNASEWKSGGRKRSELIEIIG